MMGIMHHMIDVTDIGDRSFSVVEYTRLADICIRNLLDEGNIPLVAGGTGLYINALTYPLNFTRAPADPKLRNELWERETAEPGCLYDLLRKVDPESAERLHPNDKKRIIRAIEIYESTGSTLTSYGADFSNKSEREPPFDPVMFGLTMPREILYDRINKRVDEMMRRGLLEEVRSIEQKGYDHSLPALQGLGYKQLLSHLRGECTREEAVELIKQETRRFAKRQWTWFKRDKRIQWIDVTCYNDISDVAEEIAERIKKATEVPHEQ
jgi:tRNA dimethylallyltransferase